MWLTRRKRDLQHCPVCGGDFVCPVRWREASETEVWVRLRCGECETWQEGTFSDEVLDRFDRRLDAATEQILDEADRLHREWRSSEADVFAAALDRGLIDAADFVR